MPESVRWLLINGKQESAIKILQKICRVNNVDMSTKDIIDLLECNSVENHLKQANANDLPKASIINVIKCPVILKRSIILMLIW